MNGISQATKIPALISCALFTIALWCYTARGQTNSWTNSVSGHWQDPYWSLGELPGTNQIVLFTNDDSKTLTIDSSTAQNFPDTLSIFSLTVSAPAGSFNTLVLNNVAFEKYVDQFTIGSNSAAQMDSSSFDYGGLSVGGFLSARNSYIHGDNLYLGDAGPGVFNMTNSILDAGGYAVVENLGSVFPGTFNQQGGTNFAEAVSVGIGEYNLFDGVLTNPHGPRVFIGLQGGTFNQFGGNVSANVVIGLGSYCLAGGILASGDLNIPANFNFSAGDFLQSGGTNLAGGITLGNDGGPGNYLLSGGVLIATNLVVQAHFLGGNPGEQPFPSHFSQSGGFHTNNGVQVYGMSSYQLEDGILAASSNYLDAGVMTQSGGTNLVGDILLTEESTYSLSNGWLMAHNITMQDYGAIVGLGYHLTIFQQSGGTNQIGGSLVVGGSLYQLTGGALAAQNITVSNNAVFIHQGGSATVGILTLGGGTWNEGTGGVQLGQLQLAPGISNSFLSLPANPCLLQFTDSSGLIWSTNSTLNIQHWSGSVYGGGSHQIIFGVNSAALTPQQLSQIQFENPAGLPPGNYPTRILATGEIVPDTGAPLPPAINLRNSSNGSMHLSIGGDIGSTYTIEVSTDLMHWNTWTDQYNASGTMNLDDNDATNCPQRFYRAHLIP